MAQIVTQNSNNSLAYANKGNADVLLRGLEERVFQKREEQKNRMMAANRTQTMMMANPEKFAGSQLNITDMGETDWNKDAENALQLKNADLTQDAKSVVQETVLNDGSDVMNKAVEVADMHMNQYAHIPAEQKTIKPNLPSRIADPNDDLGKFFKNGVVDKQAATTAGMDLDALKSLIETEDPDSTLEVTRTGEWVVAKKPVGAEGSAGVGTVGGNVSGGTGGGIGVGPGLSGGAGIAGGASTGGAGVRGGANGSGGTGTSGSTTTTGDGGTADPSLAALQLRMANAIKSGETYSYTKGGGGGTVKAKQSPLIQTDSLQQAGIRDENPYSYDSLMNAANVDDIGAIAASGKAAENNKYTERANYRKEFLKDFGGLYGLQARNSTIRGGENTLEITGTRGNTSESTGKTSSYSNSVNVGGAGDNDSRLKPAGAVTDNKFNTNISFYETGKVGRYKVPSATPFAKAASQANIDWIYEKGNQQYVTNASNGNLQINIPNNPPFFYDPNQNKLMFDGGEYDSDIVNKWMMGTAGRSQEKDYTGRASSSGSIEGGVTGKIDAQKTIKQRSKAPKIPEEEK
jgi:hypothetical protein